MKIAAITEGGTTISQHFGRAPLYVVLTLEAGKVVNREKRDKAGHHTFAPHSDASLAPGEIHGYDAGSQARHTSMAQTIAYCQVLIAGGMGWGAYESMKSRGIETIVTDVNNIDEAVKLYLQGKLPNLMERLH
jgi:predicted Fe-Mo cluster-binding NifX family protein